MRYRFEVAVPLSQSLLGLGPTHTVNSPTRECGHGKRGKCCLTARSHRLKKAARAEVNQARLAAKETGTRYHIQAASRGVYRVSQGELAKSQAYYPWARTLEAYAYPAI